MKIAARVDKYKSRLIVYPKNTLERYVALENILYRIYPEWDVQQVSKHVQKLGEPEQHQAEQVLQAPSLDEIDILVGQSKIIVQGQNYTPPGLSKTPVKQDSYPAQFYRAQATEIPLIYENDASDKITVYFETPHQYKSFFQNYGVNPLDMGIYIPYFKQELRTRPEGKALHTGLHHSDVELYPSGKAVFKPLAWHTYSDMYAKLMTTLENMENLGYTVSHNKIPKEK